jgi:hypothetical protein
VDLFCEYTQALMFENMCLGWRKKARAGIVEGLTTLQPVEGLTTGGAGGGSLNARQRADWAPHLIPV